MDVHCSNAKEGGGHIAFRHMLHAIEHSVFALALVGDSPSTRRLSEIFIAGACMRPAVRAQAPQRWIADLLGESAGCPCDEPFLCDIRSR